MKCDEIQSLRGPYLDSELEAKDSLEIEQHLKACAECARLFAEEQKVEARLRAALSRGQRTAALWEQIESGVVAAEQSGSRRQPRKSLAEPADWRGVFEAVGGRLQARWQAARWAWAGMAAVWGVILGLNLAAREPGAPMAQRVPSAAELRLALMQKQLLMAELAVTSEPAPTERPKSAPARPRSERSRENLNT